MDLVFNLFHYVLQWDMLPYIIGSIALFGVIALIKRCIY